MGSSRATQAGCLRNAAGPEIGLTLGLVEVALLHTLLDSTVDVGVELGIGNVADLVVGLHVLLDGLAAVQTCQHFIREGKQQRRARDGETSARREETNLLPERSLS